MDAINIAQRAFMQNNLRLKRSLEFREKNLKLWYSLDDVEAFILEKPGNWEKFQDYMKQQIAQQCMRAESMRGQQINMTFKPRGKSVVHISVHYVHDKPKVVKTAEQD